MSSHVIDFAFVRRGVLLHSKHREMHYELLNNHPLGIYGYAVRLSLFYANSTSFILGRVVNRLQSIRFRSCGAEFNKDIVAPEYSRDGQLTLAWHDTPS